MATSYLLLGGNIGDRRDYLLRSIDLLNRVAGTIMKMSAIYESEPWGFEHPRWFLNQVVEIETDLSASELLQRTGQTEQALGRIRTSGGYRERTMDIDILFYGNLVMNTPELIIPHPRIAERMFVLEPLAELVPNMIHPVLNQSVKCLRDHCSDTLRVVKYVG